MSRRDRGFTLIEVLVALVILAIGLLGLQALGVMAVHSVALASRNSRASSVATFYLEDALQQIRYDTATPGSCTAKSLSNGDLVTRDVRMASAADSASRVEVTVTPEPRGRTPLPYAIRGYVYFPEVIGKNKAGRACPDR